MRVMVNWTVIAIGSVITLFLEIIGVFIGSMSLFGSVAISTVAPLIGGFLAAHITGGGYKLAVPNGSLAGGIGSFVAAIIVLYGPNIEVILYNAAISFVISAILGLIGGLVCIFIKKKFTDRPEDN